MNVIKLIVGLGNPGTEYENTRHNAGKWLVQALATANSQKFSKERKFFGEYSKISIHNHDCYLLLPSTYMNESGIAVKACSKYFNITSQEILIVHDEIDIPPGQIRFKNGGGNGGHNGLKSVSSHLNTNDYWRLRLGVGHPGHREEVHNYVLNKPSKPEYQAILNAIITSLNLIDAIIMTDVDKVQRQLHSFQG